VVYPSGCIIRALKTTNSISSHRTTVTSNTPAVATNLTSPTGLVALRRRPRRQEKSFAELKDEFDLDVVPTSHCAANST
jgi:hypothetical protein